MPPERARSRHAALLLAALLPLLSTMPGASLAQSRPAVRSLLEMRQEKVVVQQWDLSCGAAALATLLNFQHGERLSERTVAKGLIKREEYIADPDLIRYRHGFSLLDLKRYVDRLGYQGVGMGQLDLAAALEQAPIMVPVSFDGYNHFVILRGVHGERVLLADPAYGNRTMRVDRFEQAWLDYHGLGHVGFVVRRQDGQAPPNRLAPDPEDFLILR